MRSCSAAVLMLQRSDLTTIEKRGVRFPPLGTAPPNITDNDTDPASVARDCNYLQSDSEWFGLEPWKRSHGYDGEQGTH